MASKKEILEQSQKAFADFIELCKCFFGENAVDYINQMEKDNRFYSEAQGIAKECGYDWDKLSFDESNELILCLLFDYYQKIKSDSEYTPVLTISFQKNK